MFRLPRCVTISFATHPAERTGYAYCADAGLGTDPSNRDPVCVTT